jgi:hypothetical protein
MVDSLHVILVNMCSYILQILLENNIYDNNSKEVDNNQKHYLA